MGKGKKKNRRALQEETLEKEDSGKKEEESDAGPQLSRKQKRELKLKKKKEAQLAQQQKKLEAEQEDGDDDDDEDGEEAQSSSKSAFAGLNDDDDDEEEEEDETDEEATVPTLAPKSRKQKKKEKKRQMQQSSFAALNGDDDDDEEDDEEEEEEEEEAPKAKSAFSAFDDDDDDDEEEEDEPKSSGFVVLNEDGEEEEEEEEETEANDTKKKKKDKKEKKSKKDKKEKKAKKEKKPAFFGNPEDDGNIDYDGGAGTGQDGTGDSAQQEGTEEDGAGAGAGSDKKTKKKKLSSKERKRIKEEKAKAEREKIYRQAALKETDFAVSQTVDKKGDTWLNATDVNIPSFTISAYGKTLFQNAELKLAAGRKYGLVGPNGRGKSTLVRCIAKGELEIPPSIDVLYVEQEVKADDTPAVEMVMKADKERYRLLDREAEIMAILESEAADDLEYEEYDKLQHELEDIATSLKARNSDAAEARALSILNGLGFTKEMQTAPTKSFSGGWRMRVSIARALFLEPTLLMGDELTNHLDLAAVLWLETYLAKYKKSMILISHDEDFLDTVCTDIIHLDQQRLFYYRGNYSTFQDQVEIHKEKMKKDYEKQEKELRALKSKGKTNKKAEEALAKKQGREGGAKKKGRKNKNEEQDDPESALANRQLLQRPKDYQVNFEFPPATELPPPIISVDNISFKYEGGKTLFKKLNFGIDMQSRITLVGNNGVGKSTLLKLITGELEPTKGEVKINRHLRIARYHQHFVSVLPADQTPVEFLRNKHDVTYQEARNRLGRFGLEGTAHTIKMVNCSGGQKARVVFASMSFQQPHLLILDEPTNNLDMESINALCEAINDFNGGVVVVTHDARLIQTTNCRLWLMEDKTVKEIPGGFDEYRGEILDRLEKEEEEERRRVAAKQAKANEAKARKLQEIAERRKAKAEGRPYVPPKASTSVSASAPPAPPAPPKVGDEGPPAPKAEAGAKEQESSPPADPVDDELESLFKKKKKKKKSKK